ncbi:MAG: 2-C-methyl-D-erythritol 4-phosphate cytidylyltransferase [Chloroflexi bacterium]|nr:2-C-methyl-D-erythritol 4-phosphate cytidylyltransferase [Chloroflexota bacterium]
MPVVALVLAAGSGRRLGTAVPKAFTSLDGEAILVRAVRAVAAGGVDRLVVVVPAGTIDDAAAALAELRGDLPGGEPTIVEGGTTRVDSARLGLAADRGSPDDVIVVHDAARPFAAPELFRRVVQAIGAGADGATVTLPSIDTLAQVEAVGVGAERRIVDVPDRARFVRVQTPQAFRRSVLELAHQRASSVGDTAATDDGGLVLRHVPDARLVAVPGDEQNVKITTPDDLTRALRR